MIKTALIANTVDYIRFICAGHSPMTKTTDKDYSIGAGSGGRDARAEMSNVHIGQRKTRECDVAKGVWGSFIHLGPGGPICK